MAGGGKRPGAGRPKGAPTKATKEIREAAQQFTEQALGVLETVMLSSESDAARVAAANSLLDRGWGKPRQSFEGNLNVDITVQRREQARENILGIFGIASGGQPSADATGNGAVVSPKARRGRKPGG